MLTEARGMYRSRLIALAMLSELKVFDDTGNLLLSKGLKVTHKGTGFVYTKCDVEKTPNGDVAIRLNMPDKKRFSPDLLSGKVADEEEAKNKPPSKEKFIGETDDVDFEAHEQLVVGIDEFEKEYEVR